MVQDPTPLPPDAAPASDPHTLLEQLIRCHFRLSTWNCHFRSVTPDRRDPPQPRHFPDYAIHAVTRGRISYRVNGQPLALGAGELMLMPEDAMTSVVEPTAADAQLLSVHFYPPSRGVDPLPSLALPLAVELTGPAKPVAERLGDICRAYSGPRMGHSRERPLCEAWLQEALQRLFLAAFDQGRVHRRADGAADDWYQRALALIEKGLDDPDLTVARLAERMDLSQRHFTRRFQKYAGATPKRTILQRRIELACDLLRCRPAMAIREVSRACGFADPYHFSTQFKRRTGVPPTVYRRGGVE